MPRRKTIGEKFIEFLQQELGEPVDIPRSTDVLRAPQYPGLEAKTVEYEVDESFGQANVGMFGPEMDMMEQPDRSQMPMPGEEQGTGRLIDELVE